MVPHMIPQMFKFPFYVNQKSDLLLLEMENDFNKRFSPIIIQKRG